MWAVLTFWLLLGLPGFAWLQRFDPASLQRGPLSATARAYCASLALLTPVSALGYLLHAPLWLLSAAIVALVIAALVALSYDRRWLRPLARPGAAAAICGVWLVFDLWLGARVGSHVQGDAGFHLARIRTIFTYGFNNWDPLVGRPQFEPVYHTNLYHALIAACAQLTRQDPVAAWIWTWPFVKLMAAGGCYELALTVLGLRSAAYVAALTTALCVATSATLPYPNTFAPYALVPLALAWGTDALSAPSFRHATWLGIASVLLAQIHALYALFLGLALAPVLIVRLADAVLRTRVLRRELLAALCALGLALPWFWEPARPRIEKFWNAARELIDVDLASVAHAQDPPVAPRVRAAGEKAQDQFIGAWPHRIRLDPAPFLDPNNPDAHGIAALLLACVFTRRRQAWALLAIMASVSTWLHVPALCSPLVKLLSNWAVVRFTQLYFAVCLALVPAVLVAIAVRCSPPLRQRVPAAHGGERLPDAAPAADKRRFLFAALLIAVELAGVGAAVAYADRYGTYGAPWTRETIWEAAKRGTAKETAARVSQRARFFAANVEPGAAVMAPILRDYDIPMHCACRALAFRRGRGAHGQSDMDERRAAVEQFYARDTPPDVRLAILRRYAVRYVFSSARRAHAIAVDLGEQVRSVTREGDDAIIALRP